MAEEEGLHALLGSLRLPLPIQTSSAPKTIPQNGDWVLSSVHLASELISVSGDVLLSNHMGCTTSP
jgi:hypothetical protein